MNSWPFFAGALAVGLASAAIAVFLRWLDTSGVVMIYLVAVLWTAARHGRAASLFTIALAALCSNFFFFEPHFAFGLITVDDAVALMVFLLVAMSTGTLAARVREEAEIARRRSREVEALHRLSQDLDAADDVAEQCACVERHLEQQFGLIARVYRGAEEELAGKRTIVPLRSRDRRFGTLVVWNEVGNLTALEAVAGLLAGAIERAEMRASVEDARVQAETERLRASLLAAVSHDFRTPLGSIMGAGSTLLSTEARLSPDDRQHLLKTILQSAERLDRYVVNILDLTAINAGVVRPNRDWTDIEDVIGAAVGAVENVIADRQLTISVEPELPLLRLDYVLIERVLINLLANAVKFSGPGDRIEIAARRHGDRVELEVFNTGSALSAEQLPHLFERFYRGGSEVTGTGLGLAICRGFMTLHGGDIMAAPDPERGGVGFVLRFAREEGAPVIEETSV